MMLTPFLPGNTYHIYNHANGNDNLFIQRSNYHYFLNKYKAYMSPVWHTYAYCLMPNHFHIMIKVRDTEALKCFAALQGFKILPNSNEEVDYEKLIIRRWSNFLNGYSQAFNKQQDRKGSLFRANTKRKLITDDYYFSQLVCYIHQNPVKHGFVKNLDEWEHSSYNSFLSKHNTSLEREAVLDWFGGIEGFKSFHLTDSIIVDEL